MIEAGGRRILIQGTDEAEIAIGIQRVLRKRALTVCFLEGHGELPMDNFEFHTHLEGASDHSHGDAASQVIETAGTASGACVGPWKRRATRQPSSFWPPVAPSPATARSSSPPIRAPPSCRRKARPCVPT